MKPTLRLIMAIAAIATLTTPVRAQQPVQTPPPAASAEAQRERWNRVFRQPRENIRTEAIKFDCGRDRYDLVVFTCMGGERDGMADKITETLKPGGLLVIEHFLKLPATTLGYEPGALPQLYPRLAVLRYAEDDSNPDYNQQIAGLVRFLARKRS